MAGTLPGVGVPARRRTIHRLEDSPIYREPPASMRERLHQSTTAVDMDETALRARRRLEEKLGCFRSSSRMQEGGSCKQTGGTKESRILGSKRAWHFQLMSSSRSSKSEREVCAVCLDDLRVEKQVMDLSCSHKYHSACLLPWLAAHPNCPSCRTPVQASSMLY